MVPAGNRVGGRRRTGPEHISVDIVPNERNRISASSWDLFVLRDDDYQVPRSSCIRSMLPPGEVSFRARAVSTMESRPVSLLLNLPL
jgi:hypothetical protein